MPKIGHYKSAISCCVGITVTATLASRHWLARFWKGPGVNLFDLLGSVVISSLFWWSILSSGQARIIVLFHFTQHKCFLFCLFVFSFVYGKGAMFFKSLCLESFTRQNSYVLLLSLPQKLRVFTSSRTKHIRPSGYGPNKILKGGIKTLTVRLRNVSFVLRWSCRWKGEWS